MACNGAYATAQQFASFWGLDDVCLENRDAIETVLILAASDIHVALAAVGACDCDLAGWATAYLQKLNVIDAIVYYIKLCGNPHVSDQMKETFLAWMSTQLDRISDGTVDVCEGGTGANFPAMGWGSQAVTDFAAADIIINDMLRNSED